jgi:uncharacterized OB-fold protein
MNDATEQPSAIRWYYEGLKQGVYRAVKCNACGGLTFPPTGCCEHCGSWEVEGTELSGDATLLYATHNITPACHPRFEKIAPYVYGHLHLREGPIVQAIVLGVEPSPKALHDLFNRGPVPAKAQTMAMEDLSVLVFRVKL